MPMPGVGRISNHGPIRAKDSLRAAVGQFGFGSKQNASPFERRGGWDSNPRYSKYPDFPGAIGHTPQPHSPTMPSRLLQPTSSPYPCGITRLRRLTAFGSCGVVGRHPLLYPVLREIPNSLQSSGRRLAGQLASHKLQSLLHHRTPSKPWLSPVSEKVSQAGQRTLNWLQSWGSRAIAEVRVSNSLLYTFCNLPGKLRFCL